MNDTAKTSYEEALDKGYWGTVPAETTATQPLTATGEPAVVPGQPATVDAPVDADHPLTPRPEDVQPTGSATEGDGDGQGTPDGSTTPDGDLTGDLDNL